VKITRLVHSCVLIEDDRANVLIDPGTFSWNDSSVNVDALPEIDYVLITHKHADHYSKEFVQTVLAQSPNAVVVGNQEVADELAKAGIDVVTDAPEGIEMTKLKHVKLWQDQPQPDNTVFSLWSEITIFGDNRELEKVNFAPIVVFPIVAPWGSLVDAIDRLIANPPKQVIPVHDWHLSEAGQDWYNQRMYEAFEGHDIELIPLKPTKTIDI